MGQGVGKRGTKGLTLVSVCRVPHRDSKRHGHVQELEWGTTQDRTSHFVRGCGHNSQPFVQDWAALNVSKCHLFAM